MEALAAGVPLAVSDLPVFHEIFGPAATYAATPAELAEALTAPADPERRKAGQALARSYTWQAAAEAHLAFYRSL
jgi:glycosyltransferase involved in cell wall biosynthesis